MRYLTTCLFAAVFLTSACKTLQNNNHEQSKAKDSAILVQGGDGYIFFRSDSNIVIKKCPMYTSFFEKDGSPKTTESLKVECNASESSVEISQFKKSLSQALKLSSHYLNPNDKLLTERYKLGEGNIKMDILRQQKADILVELEPIHRFLDSLKSAGVTDAEGNLSVEQLTKKRELEAKLAELEKKLSAEADIVAVIAEVNRRIESLVEVMISTPGLTKESVYIFSRDGQGFVYNILASYVNNVNILGLGLEFVPMPSGSFIMGSPESEAGRGTDEQAHKVNLLKRFEVMTTEVTQKTWFEIMGDNPSRFRTKESCPATYFEVNGTPLCPYNPVETVSWERVQEFVRRINESSPGAKYRLPSEAEWEFVARAGKQNAYVNSNDPTELKNYAWYSDNSNLKTAAIAEKDPIITYSNHRIFDMIGNVWEWTNDWYGSYPNTEVTNPVGPDVGSEKVIRGCAWSANVQNCRFANREREAAQNSSSVVGFRLVREMK